MNRFLILDSSTIISLASNCLLWVLRKLKEETGVRFVISPFVRIETVDRAVGKKKWMFEALRVKSMIDKGVIEVIDSKKYNENVEKIMFLANNIFFRGDSVHIIHKGESEMLALSNYLGAEFLGVDEKTTRLLIEDYKALWKILEKKLHTRIKFHEDNYKKLMKIIGKKYIIRSTEIVASAFQKGMFKKKISVYKSQRDIIESLLWALKLNGCAISENEIKRYISSLS